LIKKLQINWHFILDEIYKIENPNLNLGQALKNNSNKNLRFRLRKFNPLDPKQNYLEIISCMNKMSQDEINSKHRKDYIEELMKENKRNKVLEAIRYGIPNSLRFKIYLFLMNVSFYVESNENNVIESDSILLIDYLLIEDVNISVSNENYFLFEEIMKKFLKKLIRDKNIIKDIHGIRPVILIKGENSTEEIKFINGKDETEKDRNQNQEFVQYPPAGFIPFPGLAFQLACFCYLSLNLNDIYKIGKSFFSRFLSHLSSFSTNKNSVLALLFNFKYLLEKDLRLRELSNHFLTIGINIHLKFILWLSTCFADIITPSNLFILYDVILITENNMILCIFALALLYHKRKSLLCVYSQEEIYNKLDQIRYEKFCVLDLLYDYLNSWI
jgi:hypothetical protein